ncbi:hypothetical protein CHS0354_000541 [Potamilus streckersoni]|uniref:Uncharacterized protein n=1 Tax=Potamilus streckersoni TaxID=2493646 RepID=A0AAE0T7J1_9BIVA|nr:hypothetical protein CHS0354_000541 [Potamilus streckersoni]
MGIDESTPMIAALFVVCFQNIPKNRPTRTMLASDNFFFENGTKISIVNIVAVEFNIEAKEDTMAAIKAATTNPLNPTGIKFLINHGTALSLSIDPSKRKKLGSSELLVSKPAESEFKE